MSERLHRDEIDGCIVLYRMQGDRWQVARDQEECDHFRNTETKSPGRRQLGTAGLAADTQFLRVVPYVPAT
jgi:hypothetical protein